MGFPFSSKEFFWRLIQKRKRGILKVWGQNRRGRGFFGRSTEEAGKEQLQPRLSKYASCYSWILTYIRFLRVFVSKYLMYCWLVWMEKATNCFVDIGCVLILSRICLWSSPLAWAHWKIMRCGFILFQSRMFVLPLFPLLSTILVFVFPPTRHMAMSSSYGD